MLGPNSPKRSQSRPLSQLALPGFKNAFERSPKKSPRKKITEHLPVAFPPLPDANGLSEAEGEWGSGVNGDGSPGGRKWKGKGKALEPIEDDDGAVMVVSPVKSLFPKPTEDQRPVTPRSGGTGLGAGSSPLPSHFGDLVEFGNTDLDGREEAESDGYEFVPLSLAGEVMSASGSREVMAAHAVDSLSCIIGYSRTCDPQRARPQSSSSWPSIYPTQHRRRIS